MKIAGATVLITGGTGSFGHRIAASLAAKDVREVRIFSRDEKKQWEMRQALPQFRYLIGDVRDRERVEEAMQGVDFVFHAAALKHVPACEDYPLEAFKTNTLGTHNVCDAARRARVKMVVALSTDKAVKPVNSMGLSKAMMERLVCAENANHNDTVFCCVRYGNVLGSRGSVVPLFLRQIRENRPITITVPTMTRFLLTLDDAVNLVFYAFENARGGEIFVRKAPACTVKTLAETLRERHSPRGGDHPIVVTGVRPGEKIHEVLVNEYEATRAEDREEFFVVQPEYRATRAAPVATEPMEYTSASTRQLGAPAELGRVLDMMGAIEDHG